MTCSTFYLGLTGDGERTVLSELADGGTVEMVRSKSRGLSGASWRACSPVNISSKDLPFRASR